jgi:hypothetical protein
VHRSGYLVLITVVLGLLSGAPDSVCQQQQPERKALPTLTKAHDAHSLTVAVRRNMLRFPAYSTDRHDHLLMARVGCFSVVREKLPGTTLASSRLSRSAGWKE